MPAIVTFSIEIELGWGLVQYDKLDVLSPKRELETAALERLLNLCDELEIPMSFNVVGHLLRHRPMDSYNGGHPPGWFDDIPMTGSDDAPLFYAPDLIKRIEESAVNHEICTHTFSHVECANVSTETLRWEFEKVLETHNEFGLDRPVSLVPPRHSPPQREVLREYNIDVVRFSRDQAPGFSCATSHPRLALDILSGSQPIVPPQTRDDVVETYCTKYPSLTTPLLQSGQQNPHTVFRTLPRNLRQQLHLRNLNKVLSSAIRQCSHIHLWSHLWEISNHTQWPQINKFLYSVSHHKDSKDISVKKMEDLS